MFLIHYDASDGPRAILGAESAHDLRRWREICATYSCDRQAEQMVLPLDAAEGARRVVLAVNPPLWEAQARCTADGTVILDAPPVAWEDYLHMTDTLIASGRPAHQYLVRDEVLIVLSLREYPRPVNQAFE